jgi:hypothetical protein
VAGLPGSVQACQAPVANRLIYDILKTIIPTSP